MMTWMYFLYLAVLDGLHYSDRYFLQQFCSGLHTSLSFLGDYIQNTLTPWMSETRINTPVPALLRPTNLVSTLHGYARSLRRASSVLKSPRDSQQARRPNTHINALGNAKSSRPKENHLRLHALCHDAGYADSLPASDDSDSSPLADGPLSDDELYDWRVMAMTNRPQGCFWCNKDDHQLLKCTHAQKAFTDPRARRAIRGFLQESRKPYTKPDSSPSTKVHTVTIDDDDNSIADDPLPSVDPDFL
jgi:hypothetical protein